MSCKRSRPPVSGLIKPEIVELELELGLELEWARVRAQLIKLATVGRTSRPQAGRARPLYCVEFAELHSNAASQPARYLAPKQSWQMSSAPLMDTRDGEPHRAHAHTDTAAGVSKDASRI